MTRDELRTMMTGQPSPWPDFMVIGAFRYALGRETYVTHETSSWLIENWGLLAASAREVIKRDLIRTFEEDDRARSLSAKYLPLGDDCDRAEWQKLWDRIK